MKIGILALQGAFIEHERVLAGLGAQCVEIRQKKDLDGLDGLVLPGGESSVQGKLLRQLEILEPLRDLINAGTPVLATCAGLILLAQKLNNDPNVYLGTIPIEVERNAYGRQLGSFRTTAPFDGLGNVEMTFIRAPYVVKTGQDVKTLAVVNDRIVAVQYRNQIALAFHPELDADPRIHQRFLSLQR